MSEQIIIETPENIAFGYEVAGIGSRFLAALLDTLVQGVIYAALLVVFALISYTGVLAELPSWASNWIAVFILLVLFLVQFGYYIAFEIFMGGQSPGKRLLNLRVIKENGYPLSAIDVLIRNLIRIIDFFPFGYGVGVVVMFLNDRAKRLGDLAAGTLVVNVREQVKLSELQLPAEARASSVEMPGLEKLRQGDIELAESFLRRSRTLKNASALGAQIAGVLRARMDGYANASELAAMPDEVFLQRVVTAYRAAHASR